MADQHENDGERVDQADRNDVRRIILSKEVTAHEAAWRISIVTAKQPRRRGRSNATLTNLAWTGAGRPSKPSTDTDDMAGGGGRHGIVGSEAP